MRIIGIDGGGTKSVGCLITEHGEFIARETAGPTNYSRGGETEILANITELVRKLMQHIGPGAGKADLMGVCLSGLGQDWARQRIQNLLAPAGLAERLFVESDAMAALYSAFVGRPGIILIAGTGSIAFAKNKHGEILRCGGWGYILGDEGSGFDIGRNAIVAALKDLDGRGPKTSLRSRLETFFQVERLDLAVPKIYAEYASRGALARFAPMVFEEAANHDAVANQILKQAAQALADLVVTLARRIDPNAETSLALMGSIFNAQDVLLKHMQQHWQSRNVNIKLTRPEFPPEIGAALLAAESLGKKLDAMALKKLHENAKL